MDFDELYKSVKNMRIEQKSALMWALFYDACEQYTNTEYENVLTNVSQPEFYINEVNIL